jgi:hypothetical protein
MGAERLSCRRVLLAGGRLAATERGCPAEASKARRLAVACHQARGLRLWSMTPVVLGLFVAAACLFVVTFVVGWFLALGAAIFRAFRGEPAGDHGSIEQDSAGLFL